MSDSTIGWWDRMPVYEEGVQARNMTNGELFKERAAKTALVLLALIIAIVTAIGIYYCCTTTQKLGGWEGYGGWEISNRGLSVIPSILGTTSVMGLLVGARCINFEREDEEGTNRVTPQLSVN